MPENRLAVNKPRYARLANITGAALSRHILSVRAPSFLHFQIAVETEMGLRPLFQIGKQDCNTMGVFFHYNLLLSAKATVDPLGISRGR